MRIVFFGNNWLGWQVLSYLKEVGEEVVGLVLHPESRAHYRNEIRETAHAGPVQVVEAGQDAWHDKIKQMSTLKPEIGISVLFGYRLPTEALNVFPNGCLNLHPALLPFNRGSYPNVWSIVDQTPAGVTLHYMDSGLDTGDVIAQRSVAVEFVDTGETLYRKLERACLALFQETWPTIRRGENVPRIPQNPSTGTLHCLPDVERLDEIDLSATYSARQIINILRARTFPPHRGAYVRVGRKKIYLSLQLNEEEDDKE